MLIQNIQAKNVFSVDIHQKTTGKANQIFASPYFPAMPTPLGGTVSFSKEIIYKNFRYMCF